MSIASGGVSNVGDAWARRLIELGVALDEGGVEPSVLSLIDEQLLAALDRGREDLLAIANAVCPGEGTGFAIRRRIESLAERVDIFEEGRGHTYGLFALPVIIELASELPESQVESILATRVAGAMLDEAITEAMCPGGPVRVATRWYAYPDLCAPSVCRLRKQCVQIAREVALRPPPAWPFERLPRPMKRASTFLRFLIGIIEHPFGVRGVGEPVRLPQVEQVVSAILCSKLRSSVRATSRFDTSFHQALYDGMWDYQTTRLQSIAREACGVAPRPEAIVCVPGPDSKHRPRVGLRFRRGGAIEHAYLLQARPAQSAVSVFGCARDGLSAGGVENVTVVPGELLGPLNDSRWGTALPI